MSDVIGKCEVCNGLLDDEDVFCSNCGRSVEIISAMPASSSNDDVKLHYFDCDGCGASMTYDASVGTLRCPFCANEGLREKQAKRTLKPSRFVPFQIDRSQAETLLQNWLGRGFWRPGDLAKTATITQVSAVFVPHWIFSARTHSYWTADSRKTPFGARSDWYPVSGQHLGEHRQVVIGASGVLSPTETDSIRPFDLSTSVPFDGADLGDATVEQFTVARKFARPHARHVIEQRDYDLCARDYLENRFRNLRVNVRISDLRSDAVLLPVWIMAYRYRKQLYRILINGQNAKIAGDAPFSGRKLAVILIIFILIGLGVLFLQQM